jgi:hypothetical protein
VHYSTGNWNRHTRCYLLGWFFSLSVNLTFSISPLFLPSSSNIHFPNHHHIYPLGLDLIS